MLIGCGLEDVDETDPRVQTAVQQEIDKRKNELRRTCRSEIIDKAESAVDSTLRVEALKEKLSIYNPPDKPDKPSKPIIPVIEDSLDIKPLKKSSQNMDSVQNDTLINFR